LKSVFKIWGLSLVILMLLSGVLWISFGQEAQQPREERFQRFDQRASIQLENRLTKLETKMDGIERFLWLVTGAVVTLAIGNLWSFVLTRKKGSN
jgi:hypothetical protein